MGWRATTLPDVSTTRLGRIAATTDSLAQQIPSVSKKEIMTGMPGGKWSWCGGGGVRGGGGEGEWGGGYRRAGSPPIKG